MWSNRPDNELRAIAHETQASQDAFELFQLLKLARDSAVLTVLEIGVDRGYLMAAWEDALGADVLGIDISDERFDTDMRDCLILGDSASEATLNTVIRRLTGHPIDLLFIDGDHHYEGARRDYDLYEPLVAKGGLIAFHDTARQPGQIPGVETRRVFDELRPSHQSLEFWGGGDAPGIGILIK